MYEFTLEDRERLRGVLKLHDQNLCDEVFEEFIGMLEDDCQWIVWMDGYSKTAHYDELRDTLKVFKQSIRALRKIRDSKFYIPMGAIAGVVRPKDKIGHSIDANLVELIAAKQAFDSANEVLPPLEKIVQIVDYYSQEKSSARQATSTKFIQQFVKTFRLWIGEPSLYREGLFFDIVRTVFEIIGVPHKDPSKAIKAALKK